MKTLSRHLIPKDFTYYRTGSKVFYDYYKKYTDLIIERVGDGYEFIKAGRFLGPLYTVIVEKIDVEMTPEKLRKYGIHHGIIFWAPLRQVERPDGWIRFPYFLASMFMHSTRSAFSILDRPDYWNKWTSKARGHRRKILEWKQQGKLRIERIDDPYAYFEVYKKTKIPDPNKSYIISWCTKKFAQGIENMRIYMAYIDDVPLAGAVFIDEGVTSEYFTSFYHRDSKPYHLGIALMDQWFLDSYEK